MHVKIPDKIEINRELIYNAIFVGNKIRERICISWLTKENLNKVKIYGDYWDSKNSTPILNNIKPLETSKLIEKYQLRELQLIPEQVDNAQQPTVEVQKFDSVDQIVIKQLQGVDSETYDKHILTAIYNDLDVTN